MILHHRILQCKTIYKAAPKFNIHELLSNYFSYFVFRATPQKSLILYESNVEKLKKRINHYRTSAFIEISCES